SSHVSISGPGTFTPYMLVNTAGDLQLIGVNAGTRSRTYALGRDIDATTAENFAPIGSISSPFNGTFDGQFHTISNLTVAPTTEGLQNVGMFGAIAPNPQTG